jgi:cytochrome d ubiquinol oxidase subunit II
MDLPLLFALVTALSVAVYVLADGCDLGVGILFLLAPRDRDRDIMMESVAPVWDGNETWLVMGGFLLIVAFPIAYSTLLPAFYLPLMTMLFALIFRGIAFEFRFQAGGFRRVWDVAFAGGSILAALSQGLILGAFIKGVPLQGGVFSGTAFSFFSFLGLLCGAGLVGGYGLLGAGWLIWKTDGSTQVFGREVGRAALILTGAMMVVVSGWIVLTQPEIARRWFAWPRVLALSLMPLAAVAVGVLTWRSLWGKHDARTLQLGLILFLLGFGGLAISLFPYVVPRHYTVWTAAADDTSLRFVGVGVAIIVPIILAYLAHAYWVFRGKTVATGEEIQSGPLSHAGRRSRSLQNDLHLS